MQMLDRFTQWLVKKTWGGFGPDRWFPGEHAWFGRTASGVTVNPESAMTQATAFACVRLLASSVASLPCYVMKADGRSKLRAPDHSLWPILVEQSERLSDGLYILAARHDPRLVGRQLLLLHPAQRARRRNRAVSPTPWDCGCRERQGRDDLPLRVGRTQRPPSAPPRSCTSRICRLMASWGCPLYRLLGIPRRSARPRQARIELVAQWRAPQRRSEDSAGDERCAARRVQEELQGTLQRRSELGRDHGARRRHGYRPGPETFSNEDSQFLSSREFSVRDVARFFGVPAHLVGDVTRTSYGSAEVEALSFLTHSLRPWLVNFEQEVNCKLFPTRTSFFARFDVTEMMRGEQQTRYQSYASALGGGATRSVDDRCRCPRSREPAIHPGNGRALRTTQHSATRARKDRSQCER